jgi:PAS domain S-box-containing protein
MTVRAARSDKTHMPGVTLASYALIGITVVMAVLLVMLVLSLVRVGRVSGGKTDGGNEASMVSVALQDAVTRLKAQERATAARAEASERLANQILDGVSAGLIVVDKDGTVQIVNPAAKRILLLSYAAEGQPIRTLLADAAPLADAIVETLETGRPVARRKVTLMGRPSHLGVSVSPIVGGDGRRQAAVCLFTDLTAIVELEEQLKLKEALAGLGELTAGLAHEFRNGLATIHGYARLIDPVKLPEPYRPYVDGIRQETAALGEVVTNFLNFARPEPLLLVPVNLRAVIDRAVADQTLTSGRIVVGGSYGEVMGDEVLLRRALSNLVRNSVEACTAAGRDPLVQVQGEVTPTLARITISDNGPGIPAASLSRIFQPFVTTKAQGTGLGLAIVQKVIVSHNGRISAANRVEGGAEFRIQLPTSASAH